MGRLPNENQRQRALGVDTGRRALGMFRRTIASRGSQQCHGRKLDRGGTDCTQQIPVSYTHLDVYKRQQLGRDLSCRCDLRDRLARDRLGEIVDVDENPPAPAAQCIDQLVAGDRKQPRPERCVGVPCVPLQMHRQQNVLHEMCIRDRLWMVRIRSRKIPNLKAFLPNVPPQAFHDGGT